MLLKLVPPMFLKPSLPLLARSLLVSSLLITQSVSAQEIFQVQQQSQQQSVMIGGTIISGQEVTLAAQIPGRVSHISGEEGDRFRQGDMLVQIDESELLAQLREAHAALASAQAAQYNAQVQYQRELANPQSDRVTTMPGMGMPGMFDQVFSRNMSSALGMEEQGVQKRADLYQQGTQITQAQSQVNQATARIEQINAKIRDSRSIAPFDGIITSKMIETGDTLQPGQPLMKYASEGQLQVRVDVPFRLVRALQVGQQVAARLDSSPQTFNVAVAQIFPVADEQRHTVLVKFDIQNDVPAVAGMYIEVFLPDPSPVSSSPVVMIPEKALIWRGSMPSVQVLDENDQPKLRLLRIKSGSRGDMVKVYAGLRDGERILIPGTGAKE